jgi:hypothetical protein
MAKVGLKDGRAPAQGLDRFSAPLYYKGFEGILCRQRSEMGHAVVGARLDRCTRVCLFVCVAAQAPRGRPAAWHVCSTTLEEDQLNEFRELRTSYDNARRLKEQEEEQMVQDQAQEASGPVSVLRQATESQGFLAAEGVMVGLGVVLCHAAWSGVWSDYGLITYATEQQLQTATLSISAGNNTHKHTTHAGSRDLGRRLTVSLTVSPSMCVLCVSVCLCVQRM